MTTETEQRRHPEYQYLGLMQYILDNGNDRAMHIPGNQGIRTTFGVTHRYNLKEDGFPLLTTKRIFFRGVEEELRWFLEPNTNIKPLADQGVHIWDLDAYKRYKRAVGRGEAPDLTQEEYVKRVQSDPEFTKWGDLGPIYGEQWRRWPNPYGETHDQIQWLIKQLRDPIQRYRKGLIVSAWNPSFLPEVAPTEAEEMALPPCHVMFQVDVDEQDRMSLLMFQRSADMFLGVPFNIASYAMLTHMIANVTGLEPYQLVHQMGNAHLYHRHFDAAREQLTREPYPFPKVELNPDVKEIDDYKPGDIQIIGYQHHPTIRAELVGAGGRIDNPVYLNKQT